MKDPTSIHPLAQKEKPSGMIRFIRKGEVHCFCSCINRLTGNRLTWFDRDAPDINDDLSWVKSVFKAIREDSNVTVTDSIGDF